MGDGCLLCDYGNFDCAGGERIKQLGDITKINGAEIEPVWVITGGSPCQDLSVAGKRAGLAGARSGLFMEQIRVIKEIRQHERDIGRADELIRPRYMVWENVPGAFSSNGGEDFRAVLEETARIADGNADVPQPPNGKWSNAGCIMGNGWSIAWRVHDAQFWGVPQRRRRIALVADFGGQSAPEILFERKGLPGNPAESRTAGKRIAADVASGVDKAIGVKCLNPSFPQSARVYGADGVWHSLNANENGGQSRDAVLCYGICSYASNSMKSSNPHSGIYEASTARTLDLNGGNPACNQGGIMVFDARGNGNGDGASHAATLTGDHQNRVTDYTGIVTYAYQRTDELKESQVSSTQSARQYKSPTDLVAAVDCRNGTENPDVNGTLQAKEQGQNLNSNNVVRSNMTVRRLTPLECERLQGYPGGWTDIPGASDSARYKALGNSIALPFWRWMLQRMSTYLPADATLGSLFDGIGGFPLIWQEIHGSGSARWASEIEKFPIEVTKMRFKEDEP